MCLRVPETVKEERKSGVCTKEKWKLVSWKNEGMVLWPGECLLLLRGLFWELEGKGIYESRFSQESKTHTRESSGRNLIWEIKFKNVVRLKEQPWWGEVRWTQGHQDPKDKGEVVGLEPKTMGSPGRYWGLLRWSSHCWRHSWREGRREKAERQRMREREKRNLVGSLMAKEPGELWFAGTAPRVSSKAKEGWGIIWEQTETDQHKGT